MGKKGRITLQHYVTIVATMMDKAMEILEQHKDVKPPEMAQFFHKAVEHLHKDWDGSPFTWHMLASPGFAQTADEAFERLARAIAVMKPCLEATPNDMQLSRKVQEYHAK